MIDTAVATNTTWKKKSDAPAAYIAPSTYSTSVDPGSVCIKSKVNSGITPFPPEAYNAE